MISDPKQRWRKENKKDIFKSKTEKNKVMDVLKIATAGSVDDGKSTLIGRLLYDTKSLTDDKLEAIKESSRKRGYDYVDFSLATDGLVAEREQGITIDVAHIYFSTKNRSYIIADTPGHVEYTRNMVTGASTSQVSIILIDARKGVIEQTYRHFFITNLLRMKQVVVAVNKMDLVDYSEEVFNEIKSSFKQLKKQSAYAEQELHFVPISALKGDNVVSKSENTSWYNGNSILEYLEDLQPESLKEEEATRIPVQHVIRPKQEEFHDFRGYAGKVYGDAIQVGDEVTVLPSLKQSKVKSILFFEQEYNSAENGNAVTITLEDEINISRGDTIVKATHVPRATKTLNATICWMDNTALTSGKKYYIQHNTNRVLAKIDQIEEVIATDFSGNASAQLLKLNEIGNVSIKLSKPIFYDRYDENRANGSFILIDTLTNTTSGVGFIQ